MSFSLPELPYAYDALAPYMSRETLEYHHDKHHLAYVNTGNTLLKGTEWEGKSLEQIVKGSFGKNAPLFNNAGQHFNHTHFWQWMKPNGGGDKLPGNLEKKINADLGSLAKMKEAGVAINEVDDKKSFVAAVQPVWAKYGSQHKPLIDRIQDVK